MAGQPSMTCVSIHGRSLSTLETEQVDTETVDLAFFQAREKGDREKDPGCVPSWTVWIAHVTAEVHMGPTGPARCEGPGQVSD